jgi:hypothetical protein
MDPSSPHPDRGLLERWRSRSLTAPEILAVSRHLAECPRCRAELAASASPTGVARALDRLLAEERDVPAHLTADELAGWVDHTLDAVAAELVVSHLEVCPLCRSEADELAAFARTGEAARPPARRRTWAALAASLAVVSVSAWLALRYAAPPPAGRPAAPTPVSREGPAVAPAAEALLRDGPLLVDATGSIAGVDRRWWPQVEGALRAPDLTLPAAALALARGPERQRAESGAPPAVRLAEPLSRVVLADRPTFRWRGPADWVYRVEIYDERFAQVAASGTLRATSWTPALPLPRGELLSWKVAAAGGGEETSYPTAPEIPAAFRIATAETASEVSAARATASHLLVGLALWRAGLVEEAAAELAALEAANPDAGIAHQLAASSARGARRLRSNVGPR